MTTRGCRLWGPRLSNILGSAGRPFSLISCQDHVLPVKLLQARDLHLTFRLTIETPLASMQGFKWCCACEIETALSDDKLERADR